MSGGIKNRPDRKANNLCQGRELNPRCHLGSRPKPYSQRDTDISPATDVCPHVAEYSAKRLSPRPQRPILQPASRFGSQPPELSARAQLLLLPLQRFNWFYSIAKIILRPRKFVKRFFGGNSQRTTNDVCAKVQLNSFSLYGTCMNTQTARTAKAHTRFRYLYKICIDKALPDASKSAINLKQGFPVQYQNLYP